MSRKRTLTFFQRFIKKYRTSKKGCWEWVGCKNKSGYGLIANENMKIKFAHRSSYTFFIGEISKGMCVCHKCDNPSCVNPFHLFLGTQKDNLRDMYDKNRHKNSIKRCPSQGRYYIDKCRCEKCIKYINDYRFKNKERRAIYRANKLAGKI